MGRESHPWCRGSFIYIEFGSRAAFNPLAYRSLPIAYCLLPFASNPELFGLIFKKIDRVHNQVRHQEKERNAAAA
jgi:hypothetical protein